jgi:TRAP-type C4-dicarboxylate transport system permease small subunit
MKKHLKLIASLLVLTALLVLPYFVFAQNATQTPATSDIPAIEKLQTVASAGYNIDMSLPIVVGTVIRAALGLLGIIFIIVVIIAGFRWMTASGNEEKVTKASGAIKRGIIGLIIVISAWAVWTFLLERLIIGVG